MVDIDKYVKKKEKKRKRNKIIKKIIIIGAILMSVSTLLMKAPIFNIKKVTFKNVKKVNQVYIDEIKKDLIGCNILTYNKKKLKQELNEISYIKDYKIKITGINQIKIEIEEIVPTFYKIDDENNYIIINDKFQVLETVNNINDYNLVKFICNKELKPEEQKIYSEAMNKFSPYVIQNKTDLKFDSIDFTDIYDIKAYMGDVLIKFGSTDNLHEKIETVYRVLLSDNINFKKGYIDLSFNSKPVFKNETVDEIENSSFIDENIGEGN